jgi:hypothetical protein
MSENFSKAQFPQKRLDQMIAAAQVFDPREYRADAMTPRSMAILQSIDPTLAFKVQTGTMRGFHRDAAESLFFARQLEYIRPGLFEVLYPALEAKNYIPLETAIAPGAEIFTYRAMDKVGRAQLIKDYATDPPRVDVMGIEKSQQIRGISDMYGYTTQELRAAMLAQLPLDVRKAMAARYAVALLVDEVLWYGHADVNAEQSTAGLDAAALNAGMVGLANLANTTSFTTPTGSASSQLWRRKNADEIVADMHAVVNNIVRTTLGIHRPDSLILPLAAYNIASTKRMGDGSNQTCLDFFLATSPYVKNVDPSYRLDAAQSANWSGTTGRAIAYEKNPERLAGLLPLEFEQMPPQQEHFEIRTACHARIGGVVAFYPKSVSYMDGITDTSD